MDDIRNVSVFPLAACSLGLLLHHNRYLRRLHLPAIIFDGNDEASGQCLDGLSRLHYLQHLTLQNSAPSQRTTFSLLRVSLALPRLKELILDFVAEWEEDIHQRIPELDMAIAEALKVRSSALSIATKIPALQLPESEWDMNPLVFPLLESGLLDLKSCTIPRFCDQDSPDRIERTIRERCPNLRHLKCLRFWRPSGHAQDMCTFFRGCSNLETFRGNAEFCDRGQTGDVTRNIVSTLVQCHSSTLEEIEVLKCSQFSSNAQRHSLSECKQLKRFWIVQHENGGGGVTFEDLVEAQWACTQLKELGLAMSRYTEREEGLVESIKDVEEDERRPGVTKQKQTMAVWIVKRLYVQIGRLDHLGVLFLGADKSWGDLTGFEWDLTPSKGGLSELAGLEDLADFEMRTDLWSGMGNAEVEFMHEKWPRLRKITFGTWSTTFRKLMMEPHCLWLQARRPQLQFGWTNPANE
ncbi:hypothetical protein KVV02_006567 [Mortierella alpina]|uniref:Uncharacterized protein n=1 Tax=Mortierella alpina TaxID=64518 RepID=A0A9P8CZC2_MORAP|nr:hypothetical protein KVV02_006567 [Mortierella alpina]